jgi:pteridine reductase
MYERFLGQKWERSTCRRAMCLSSGKLFGYAGGMTSKQPVALITGGAKRVGRAISMKLAEAGFHVAITYNTSDNEALELGKTLGKQALLIRADLTDLPAAPEQIRSQVTEEFGRVDVLVNNASAYLPSRLATTDLALMRKLMSVHFEAPLLLCQKFEPILRASRGHVINMVDLLAEKPWPEYLAYCATKAALMNLTLGLARELAPEVTVNGIAPGVVGWPDNYPETGKATYLKRVPLQRAGTPDDVANLVHFLATEGSYVTGQIIRLDGGRSIT